MLPMFSVIPYLNSASFKENPSMRAVATVLSPRGREQSFNYNSCEHFEKRPNFASTF